MNIAFLSFFYTPDISPGAFRSEALVKSLSASEKNCTIHVITTFPNRYKVSEELTEDGLDLEGVVIHRIKVPPHNGKTLPQFLSFFTYSIKSFFILVKIKPDFFFCTTGRHMTSLLTFFYSFVFRKPYYIDFRDIFSEAIFDMFVSKNILVAGLLKRVLFFLERVVLSNAEGVNVVSEDFYSYYQEAGMDTSSWTFIPNGIDAQFMDIKPLKTAQRKVPLVLYAGNLGKMQGIENILPKVISNSNGFIFNVIGDGAGKKDLLTNLIHQEDVFRFYDPVPRESLLDYYLESDILFLHLNPLPALKRSLPSKIFEYAVIGKPIVAGLPGYSKRFVEENIPHAYLFNPGDTQGCIDALERAKGSVVNQKHIEEFKQKSSRRKLSDSLSEIILECVDTC